MHALAQIATQKKNNTKNKCLIVGNFLIMYQEYLYENFRQYDSILCILTFVVFYQFVFVKSFNKQRTACVYTADAYIFKDSNRIQCAKQM